MLTVLSVLPFVWFCFVISFALSLYIFTYDQSEMVVQMVLEILREQDNFH